MKKKLLLAILALAFGALRLEADAAPDSSSTASSSDSSSDLERRLSALEDKVNSLSAASPNSSSNSQGYGGAAGAPAAADLQGLTLRSVDGLNTLSLRGWIQFQDRNYFGDAAVKLPVDSFLINEAREYLEGTLWGNTGYRLLTDFKGGAVSLLDAYVDYSFLPEHNLTVRVGKFKAPVGLERLQDSRFNEFAELGLPSNLAPNRDLGLALSGYLLDPKFVNVTVALLNGAQDNSSSYTTDTSETDDKEFDARIFSLPFSKTDWAPLKKIGIGIAGSYGPRNDYLYNTNASPFSPPSYLSAGQQSIFSYNANVGWTGVQSRFSPQAYWYWKQFGLLGEYIESFNDVSATVSGISVVSQIPAQAYQVEAEIVLTGEDASFEGVKPRHNVDFANGGFGAFELVASYGDLQIGHAAFANGLYANDTTSVSEAQQSAFGLNWYLNPAVKWQADWFQTWFQAGGGGTIASPLDREEEQAAITQIQVAF